MTLDHMPCECEGKVHELQLFRDFPHWPGERFIVRQALRLYQEHNQGCSPTELELAQLIVPIVEYLHIARTMVDNTLNFGTVKLDGDGRIVLGDDIPLRLLERNG